MQSVFSSVDGWPNPKPTLWSLQQSCSRFAASALQTCFSLHAKLSGKAFAGRTVLRQTAGDSVIRLEPKSMQNNSLFMGFWAIILPTFGGLGKPESPVMFAISVLPDHLPFVRQSHQLRRAAVRISSPPTRAPRLRQHLEQARV